MMRRAQFGEEPNQRETQVAIAILFGHPSKQIARELNIGRRTVDHYRYRLYVKFGARTQRKFVAILTGMAHVTWRAAE